MSEHQKVICLVWDFDKTLIPGYMQAPLFARYGVEQDEFWREANGLAEYYRAHGIERMSGGSAYLNHILTYVAAGIFAGLNNSLLRSLGGELSFFPGLPEFFGEIRERIEGDPRYAGIRLEHYIVSSGLTEMVRGSSIAKYVDGVWASEFIEHPAAPGYRSRSHAGQPPGSAQIRQIAYVLDDTSKTRALYEINKGSNKQRHIDVNAYMPHEQRRVPLQDMIYIADGQSDVPCFSVVNQGNGQTYAVYGAGDSHGRATAERLLREKRVNWFGEADYRAGSPTYNWLLRAAERVADNIVHRHRQVARALAQQRFDLPTGPAAAPEPPRPRRRRR